MMTVVESRLELELPCALTDEEVQSRGRMLGETIWAIDETNTARSAAMKEFKERLVGLNESQRKLAHIIRERVEKRMVRCWVAWHMPCEGTKRIIRLGTGEVVREEPMTDSEKQGNLFAAQSLFEAFMQGQGVDHAPRDVKPEVPPEDAPDEPEPEKE